MAPTDMWLWFKDDGRLIFMSDQPSFDIKLKGTYLQWVNKLGSVVHRSQSRCKVRHILIISLLSNS